MKFQNTIVHGVLAAFFLAACAKDRPNDKDAGADTDAQADTDVVPGDTDSVTDTDVTPGDSDQADSDAGDTDVGDTDVAAATKPKIFVLAFENHSADQIYGSSSAKYLTSLF